MSKSKPRKVFEVTVPGTSIIVLARHEKGARSVANQHHEGPVLTKLNSLVQQVGDNLATQAVNRSE